MSKQDIEILVIDDDPIYHIMITKILKNLGFHNIKSIQDSTEGLEYLLKNSSLPDVLLLDINMPSKNGWDILNELSNSNINFDKMSIYIVTSSIDKCDIKKSTQYPISDFLNKPLKTETLEKILIEI